MADTLIETVASNPYEGIYADTNNQISDINSQIESVTTAINNLEKSNPTSTLLPQLRERLATLQARKEGLGQTSDAAKSLMESYSKSMNNISSLAGIYDLKQAELKDEKNKAEAEYNSMEDETRQQGQNYVNALQNATASENAIINANAGRQGASAQSTAETRARNYLSAAQAGNEAANTNLQNINAIREGKISSNQGYTQLSQNNADNYLRQQVMNDWQSTESEKDRQLQRDLTTQQIAASKSSSSNNSKIDPSNWTTEQRNSVVDYYNKHFAEDDKGDTEDEEKEK